MKVCDRYEIKYDTVIQAALESRSNYSRSRHIRVLGAPHYTPEASCYNHVVIIRYSLLVVTDSNGQGSVETWLVAVETRHGPATKKLPNDLVRNSVLSGRLGVYKYC